jgi:uncharacterized protein (DUF2141 family)
VSTGEVWAMLAAAVLGDAGCGSAPAIRVEVEGLRDRRGELKLELYPANEHDWLRDDRDLVREGKLFRRVRVPTPQQGPVALCIRVPGPGRYGLFFTHNRDGKNKFSFWADGAGLPANAKIGRARPKLAQGIVEVGAGTAGVTIRAQYLRGLSGFGPAR